MDQASYQHFISPTVCTAWTIWVKLRRAAVIQQLHDGRRRLYSWGAKMMASSLTEEDQGVLVTDKLKTSQ